MGSAKTDPAPRTAPLGIFPTNLMSPPGTLPTPRAIRRRSTCQRELSIAAASERTMTGVTRRVDAAHLPSRDSRRHAAEPICNGWYVASSVVAAFVLMLARSQERLPLGAGWL